MPGEAMQLSGVLNRFQTLFQLGLRIVLRNHLHCNNYNTCKLLFSSKLLIIIKGILITSVILLKSPGENTEEAMDEAQVQINRTSKTGY